MESADVSTHRAVLCASLIAALLFAAASPLASAADVTLSRTGGGIAFTFSAGYASATTAADILETQGMRGTFYIVSTQLREGPYYTAYVSASDVANLSARGHEIGSMGVTQRDLTTLGDAQLVSELRDSRSTLESITGRPVAQLAYPYGAVNPNVAARAAEYYASGRVISWTIEDFTPTVDSANLPGFIMRRSTSLGEAQWIVDQAAERNVVVILSFGRIGTEGGTYDWTPADLDALVRYAKQKGVATPTVSQLAGGADPAVPSAPVLGATAGSATVDLSWSVPPSGGSLITSYTLYRGTTAGGETLYRTLPPLTSFRDVNVTNGATYHYRVSASNMVGEGARSASVQSTPQLPGVPSGATVVFTFDDGSKTHVGAAQTLADKGFRGTFYIISDCPRSEVDTTLCMTTDQVKALSQAGHDIAAHTVRHVDLASVSSKTLSNELKRSKSTLESLTGESVDHMAYPYGSHNPTVRSEVAKSYASGRIFLSNPPVAALPDLLAQSGTNPYLLPGVGVTKATSVADAKAYVDYAIAHNTTIVLAFHDIMNSGGDIYTWSTGDFAALVDYTASTKVNVRTIAQVYG